MSSWNFSRKNTGKVQGASRATAKCCTRGCGEVFTLDSTDENARKLFMMVNVNIWIPLYHLLDSTVILWTPHFG